MNREFLVKFIEAKAMEIEAFQTLLPKPMEKHMKVIGKEIVEMTKELCPSNKSENTGATKINVE